MFLPGERPQPVGLAALTGAAGGGVYFSYGRREPSFCEEFTACRVKSSLHLYNFRNAQICFIRQCRDATKISQTRRYVSYTVECLAP